MIRQCNDSDFDTIHAIANDAAQAYEGVIPAGQIETSVVPGEGE